MEAPDTHIHPYPETQNEKRGNVKRQESAALTKQGDCFAPACLQQLSQQTQVPQAEAHSTMYSAPLSQQQSQEVLLEMALTSLGVHWH